MNTFVQQKAFIFLSHTHMFMWTHSSHAMHDSTRPSTHLTIQQSEDNRSLGSFALAKQAHTFLPSGTQRYSLYYQK